jgi:hypothetical protein
MKIKPYRAGVSWVFQGVSNIFQNSGLRFFFSPRVGNSLLGNLPIQDLSRHEPSMNFLITPSHHHTIRISGRDIASIATSIWIAITSS